MPYLECRGCRLSFYSAASRSWRSDSCPVCGESLAGASRRFPSEIGARTLCREFPSTPGAIAGARHALDSLYGELGDEAHSTAVLLVSELVSNSVRYSKASNGVIELLACVTPTVVRVEVSDDGEGFEPIAPVDDDARWGHGLEILEQLADRWGRAIGARTSVWFELRRTAASVHGSARELGLAT